MHHAPCTMHHAPCCSVLYLGADPNIGTPEHPEGALQCAQERLDDHGGHGHRTVVRVLKDHARLCT